MGTFTDRMTSVGWLPARTRAKLNRAIKARNALDRQLAEAKGLDPESPQCARFQGVQYREALDRAVRSTGAGRRYVLGKAGLLKPGEAPEVGG